MVYEENDGTESDSLKVIFVIPDQSELPSDTSAFHEVLMVWKETGPPPASIHTRENRGTILRASILGID